MKMKHKFRRDDIVINILVPWVRFKLKFVKIEKYIKVLENVLVYIGLLAGG